MRNSKAKTVARMGLMLALALILALMERMIPPLPMLPPGVNLGLANIVVMYCVFFLGARHAFGIAALKSAFVALTRGPVAGALSLCGGLLSLLVIWVLIAAFKRRISYVATSICGAVGHNAGQIFLASLILNTMALYYLPVLIVSGIVMGMMTGATLTVLLPILHRISGMGSGSR